MAGPGIRYWNFANELAKTNKVILMTPNECELKASFEICKLSHNRLKKELIHAKAIIVQGITLWHHSFIKKSNVPIIVDLYDPFIFENFEMFYDSPNSNKLHSGSLDILLDQLMYGDYFICASEKQKDFWIGMLAAVNRINPLEYSESKDLSSLIGIVPFGLEDEMPTQTKAVMKGVVPGIEKDDFVVLWGGGVWPWLDPKTAIHAIHRVSQKHNHVKLFFMGIKHPNPEIPTMKIVEEIKQLSDELNLTNKHVFFNDWVQYNERYHYYLEADIGISLHHQHIETRFSFRTRMLDYIRCELPIVCTSGDSFADIVNQFNIGVVVDQKDDQQLAEKIEKMIEDGYNYQSNNELLTKFTWHECVKPLNTFCQNPKLSKGKLLVKTAKSKSKFDYYFSKLVHYASTGDFKYIFKKALAKLRRD